MRGQYRPREAIIGHETPLGRVPEIKKINIFFWKHPILGPRFRRHFEGYWSRIMKPKVITNLKFNLSQKKFEKIHVEKFSRLLKIRNFRFLKVDFWVTWSFLPAIKSTSESQIPWIFRKLKNEKQTSNFDTPISAIYRLIFRIFLGNTGITKLNFQMRRKFTNITRGKIFHEYQNS